MTLKYSRQLVYYSAMISKLRNNAETPKSDIRKFYKKYKDETTALFWISRNKNTPKDILKVLATNKSSGIRWNTVLNPNTSSETILSLKTDSDPEIVKLVESKIQQMKKDSVNAWNKK